MTWQECKNCGNPYLQKGPWHVLCQQCHIKKRLGEQFWIKRKAADAMAGEAAFDET